MSNAAERVRAFLSARTGHADGEPTDPNVAETFDWDTAEPVYLREADLETLLQPEPEQYLTNPQDCPHTWQPLSFRFETQLLDAAGRVLIRQPDMDEAKVYCVCMSCAQWTYITTSFTGSQQYGSAHRAELREQEESTPE